MAIRDIVKLHELIVSRDDSILRVNVAQKVFRLRAGRDASIAFWLLEQVDFPARTRPNVRPTA